MKLMMMFGMMYSQGDIVIVPLPFTDLTGRKKRPVIVLSNHKYNEISDDMLVAAVTSNLQKKSYTVKITNDDLQEGTLAVDSCIRADKIYTISQDAALKQFGKVNDGIITKIKYEINKLMDEIKSHE